MKIKHLIFYVALLLAYVPAVHAQQISSDTLSYEIQRKKVNELLHNRSVKFGEYDVSLQEKNRNIRTL
ncbi:hypothetical protein HMPREF0765_2819 [Sphingobacterium spiritivorum ATCC 33300]|uniref:Uncharacterized protein n=1 Tax=Sphingobacterium spiritivorum ATCC 33300 TaxID=525372 RepID=C2FZR3_SPHSI|nr:hypothetical protein [Sphingobacterium spiritivorum]EEI91509.1 hypothetical protein HMPREF0765_2819 [Sphingobacterium spiritivorum ATCC 33300]